MKIQYLSKFEFRSEKINVLIKLLKLDTNFY